MAEPGQVYDKDIDEKNSPIQHANANNLTPEDEKSVDSSSLNESEMGGLYSPGDVVDAGPGSKFGRGFNKGKGLFKSLTGSRKKKIILAGLGGSGALMVMVVVVLLMIASSLKIPNLAQHITTYEFARITRQFSQSAQRITSEKLVLASEFDAKPTKLTFADQVKAKYPNSIGKASSMLDKLSSYKPENVIKTLGQDNNLRLNFTNSKFTGTTLGGKTFEVKKLGKFTGKVPLLKDTLTFKNQLQFSRDFAPALDSAMKLNDVGPIIRGATAREIRQRLGIGLVAWNLGKFQGKTAAAAQAEELRAKNAAIGSTAEPTLTSKVSDVQKTSEAVIKNEAIIDSSDELLTEVFDNGGVAKSTQTIIDEGLGGSLFKTAIAFGNPAYAIALPICIIFDGSISSSEGTINNNTQKQQSAYYYIAKAADQQKTGSTNSTDDSALATAVNATNSDLGNISGSVPEVRASGGNLDDIGVGISAEASASGQYSLFNVFLGNNPVSSVATGIADNACSKLTDIRVAFGLLAVNVALNIFTAGGVGIGEKLLQEGSTTIVTKVSQSVADKVVSRTFAKLTGKAASEKFTIAATKSRAGKFIWGNAKSITAVTGATVMAKLLVMQQSGLLFSGFSQGEDLANMAAAGGNIQAGELSRQQMFGRPLTNAEIAQSDQTDGQFIAYQNRSRSFIDRYFSTHNSDSLVTHMAMSVNATFHGGLVASIVKLCGYIVQPFKSFGSLLGSVAGKAKAAPDPSTLHYGNVQFGWSQAEENLINSDGSYQPLENQLVIDNNKEAVKTIAKTYAECFGYASDDDGNLTPIGSNSGEGTLGELLASGKLQRDDTGGVLTGSASDSDKYICSPYNLGKDLVMRWRLSMSYGTTIDQLTNMQDVTN